ncbi:hypothetical protein, partial [Microbacterium sp. MPKO10]|uniref:hypothetical protein n=1 Tax=Microbacterium sp. MPKO10 TaxID=2989818 RepID=UPI002235A458
LTFAINQSKESQPRQKAQAEVQKLAFDMCTLLSSQGPDASEVIPCGICLRATSLLYHTRTEPDAVKAR